jgi:hypothetical protein
MQNYANRFKKKAVAFANKIREAAAFFSISYPYYTITTNVFVLLFIRFRFMSFQTTL